VAEGIASTADLQALMVMGCDFGQGALIAPPMPKDRLLELLRARLNKPRPVAPNDIVQAGAQSVGRVA
jgi:EAL domain-containing protein (putative c-di-GMP-specific phosphodiesterase class I)